MLLLRIFQCWIMMTCMLFTEGGSGQGQPFPPPENCVETFRIEEDGIDIFIIPGVVNCFSCALDTQVEVVWQTEGSEAPVERDNYLIIAIPETYILPGISGRRNITCISTIDNGLLPLRARLASPFLAPPSFPDATFTEGDLLMITCDTMNIPENTTHEILDPNGVPVSAPMGVFSVSIVTRAYAGTYTCVVMSTIDNSTVNDTSNVIIQYVPEITTTNSSTQFVVLGENLHLQCGYAGVPAPTVQWFYNSTLLTRESVGVNITDGAVGSNEYTTIEIYSFNRADEGTYTCRATNSLGSDEDIYTIQIAVPYCEAETVLTVSGITYSWPRTRGEETVGVTCPVDANVIVMRNCSYEGLWQTFTEEGCETVNEQLGRLNNSFSNLTNETYADAVSMLSQIVVRTENNTAEQTSEVLSQVATYFEDLANFVNESNVIINMTIIEDVVNVVNSLLQWEPGNIMVTSSSSVVESFETVTSTYAQQLSLNETQNFTTPSITVVTELNSVDSLARTGRSFFVGENDAMIVLEDVVEDGQLASQLDAAIGLPATLFGQIEDRANVGVFFAFYEIPILFPVSGELNGNLSRKTVVGSQVLAATVGPTTSINFQNLNEPITIVLRLQVSEGSFVAQGTEMCVSWDFTLQDWITDGCTTLVGEDGIVTCNCDHLTNFAVLVDICLRQKDCERSRVDQALTYISYIGISISIVCLVVTILTLLMFKKIREKDITKYHLQLCLSLLFMFVLTLILIVFSAEKVTTIYGGCVSLSLLVHYFTLVAVMWMGAEALLMFQKLVIVFVRITTKFIIFVSIICWTVPFIFVIVPFIVDLVNGYDHTSDIIVQRAEMKDDISYCFLSQIGALIGAFLAPIFLILAINVVIFIWVVTVVIRHAREKVARTDKAMSDKHIVRMTISISGIMFLFGLSWLFFVLTFSFPGLRETFQILFTVFNSLQGFFIFAFILFTEGFDYWKALLSCEKHKPKHPSHGTNVPKGKQSTDLNTLSKQEKSTSEISPYVLTTGMDTEKFMY